MWEGMTMQLTLTVNVKVQDCGCVVTATDVKAITFSKEQTVQKKVSIIILGELCSLPKSQLAQAFGFKTRKSYFNTRHAVLNGSTADLLPKRTGPYTAPK